MGTDGSPQIVILTGERGTGKTTVCERAISLAQSQGRTCSGIITLRRSHDILDARDVRSGRVRRLTFESEGDVTLRLGPYRFDPETFAWGNEVLANALPCDLLVVDELGPLELERGVGWTAALGLLQQSSFALAVVVVRPGLVARARDLLPAEDVTLLAVTQLNRGSLPPVIVDMVKLGKSVPID